MKKDFGKLEWIQEILSYLQVSYDFMEPLKVFLLLGVYNKWSTCLYNLTVFLNFQRILQDISYFVKVELLSTLLGPNQAVSNILDHR